MGFSRKKGRSGYQFVESYPLGYPGEKWDTPSDIQAIFLLNALDIRSFFDIFPSLFWTWHLYT